MNSFSRPTPSFYVMLVRYIMGSYSSLKLLRHLENVISITASFLTKYKLILWRNENFCGLILKYYRIWDLTKKFAEQFGIKQEFSHYFEWELNVFTINSQQIDCDLHDKEIELLANCVIAYSHLGGSCGGGCDAIRLIGHVELRPFIPIVSLLFRTQIYTYLPSFVFLRSFAEKTLYTFQLAGL